ncbi:ABC-F family ATP-binding cassette domain-containing protein [Flexilinea flocculi]|jgi:ATP-binding cassette subfamily F protein 3|uniref:ATPase component of ABC transporter with duplicated ATPase domains n=1 Tax=Flexilinea flocculi TaxID=1678840 RepID=A0A0K8PAE1_9CHLR|nr:ABC-F family ATP-binding cassette domain-containing protein [Flexilinea flocculi]GAP39115.1 ATPase component of ABC transporter with duplicated ATPase domains [Flexilinea flocculi]
MPLITANNISKSFGDNDILSSISLSVPHKARIGFVGANGSGKTTLLKILLGLESPDSGSVIRAKNTRIGYLPQQINVSYARTPMEECLSLFSDLDSIQGKMIALEKEMQEKNYDQSVLDDYGRLQILFEEKGGYQFEARVKQVLQGLGLKNGEENRPWNQLSGGQKTRAYIAKILLSDPDLLVFDEPTNHLDISAIEWLESFLKDFSGAVLMVSHDRYFLDQTVNIIWELSPEFETYHGNYSAYLAQREERYVRHLQEFEAQQAFIEKEEEYIRRNLEGQNTRQAQGRRTRLERMLKDAKITKPRTEKSIRLNLSSDLRSGDLVLRTKDVKIGYQDDQKVLFSLPDLTLVRGECAAVIGPNGVGKTTLIKTILAQIPPLSGNVQLGSNLKIGYFAQAHEGLHPDSDLMDEIQTVSPQMLPSEIRSYLARFHFTGDDIYKPVKILSGGERGRLALAILALQGANLLMLDEPMNHLDIESQEVLQSVLKDFNGTIILVSHDRFLIDGIATQIWEVLPKKKTLQLYQGTYSQYKEWLKQKDEAQNAKSVIIKQEKNYKAPAQNVSLQSDRKKKQKKSFLEEEIQKLEEECSLIGTKLEDKSLDFEAIAKLGLEYNALQDQLNQMIEEWASINIDE